MSIRSVVGRIIHHQPKLTDEQRREKVFQNREQLRKSGFWIGVG